jgi:hypothetical protein
MLRGMLHVRAGAFGDQFRTLPALPFGFALGACCSPAFLPLPFGLSELIVKTVPAHLSLLCQQRLLRRLLHQPLNVGNRRRNIGP